jgi:uncharacterized protein (TIGR02246 family)
MSEHEGCADGLTEQDEVAIRGLYERMLGGWNARDGDAFAAPFVEDGAVIGFDGSEVAGRAEIGAAQARIFADHPTARYVWKVRSVRQLASGAALLRGIAGMVRPGQTDIEPSVNALHTMVAVQRDGQWGIAHFQNTPAQYHGRPEMVAQMTEELRALL